MIMNQGACTAYLPSYAGLMSLLLKHDWSDASVPWLEKHLQMAVVQSLHRFEDTHAGQFTFAGDMNGMKASSGMVAAEAKLMGMRSGETDLRLFFPGSYLLLVEMKLATGALSKQQRERHDLFRKLGFRVELVWASTPADAVAQVSALVDGVLGHGD
jgi:hypothetical protein